MIDGAVEYLAVMEVIIPVLIVIIQDIWLHINGKIVLLYVIYFSMSFQTIFLFYRSTKGHGVTSVHRILMTILVFKRLLVKLLPLSGCETT
jgi:hypothetical protein